MTTADCVRVPCTEPGCPAGIDVQRRHADNFAGRFYCPGHVHSDAHLAQEVPC